MKICIDTRHRQGTGLLITEKLFVLNEAGCVLNIAKMCYAMHIMLLWNAKSLLLWHYG